MIPEKKFGIATKKFIDQKSNLTNYEIAIRDENGIWKRAIFDAQTIADSKKILTLTDYGAYFSGKEKGFFHFFEKKNDSYNHND